MPSSGELECSQRSTSRRAVDIVRRFLSKRRSEAFAWAAVEAAVLGDGQWAVIPGEAFRRLHQGELSARADSVSDDAAVGVAGAISSDAEDRHARRCLADFRNRYNCFRPHGSLRPAEDGIPLVPEEVDAKGRVVPLPRWQGWAKAAKEKLDEMM